MRLGWIVACAMLEACSPFGGGAFTCMQDSQCLLAGMQGTCQPSTNMCSFSDPSCTPSNQRYGSQSGALAGACVGGSNLPTDAAPIDFGAPDTAPAPIDATCRIADIDFCSQGFEPAGPLDVGSDLSINTDTDPRCLTYHQPNAGPDACLILVSSFAISDGAKLVAQGNRPLVIAASGSITISGLLDVSSNNNQHGAGATSSNCNAHAVNASDNPDGASGGAGGSFSGHGGDSGTGNTDAQPPKKTAPPSKHGDPQGMPAFARGGCKGLDGGGIPGIGGGGNGGDPGGSVWLYANPSITVDMTGVIAAGGGGGRGGTATAGGGGGGTGGFIRLMAENISIMGTLAANGGGAGQGGKSGIFTANDGSSGKTSNQAANGGSGGNGFYGGDGGNGGTSSDGSNGSDSTAGAGGGGGGTGFIELLGAQTLGGTISPAPTTPM